MFQNTNNAFTGNKRRQKFILEPLEQQVFVFMTQILVNQPLPYIAVGLHFFFRAMFLPNPTKADSLLRMNSFPLLRKQPGTTKSDPILRAYPR